MIKKITPELILSARKKFPSQKSLPDKKLVTRYLISQKLKASHAIEYFPKEGVFKHPSRSIYWSISYKENFVMTEVSSEKIGIDLEIFKARDELLFNSFSKEEWENAGQKNWENFYILWTGKESIIKYKSLTLDDMQKIKFKRKTRRKSFFEYDGEVLSVSFFVTPFYIYSITPSS